MGTNAAGVFAGRKIVLASRPIGIVAGLLAQTALTGVLRAHWGSKAALLFAAALMVVVLVAALPGLFRRLPAGCGPRRGGHVRPAPLMITAPLSSPPASKCPHCYVAMPILPSNSEDKLGESCRDFAKLKDSPRLSEFLQVAPRVAKFARKPRRRPWCRDRRSNHPPPERL
jgi:hypothetical protein